jgi:ABC-2 type transport system permease protein
VTGEQTRAVIWAQWRSFVNHGLRRNKSSFALSAFLMTLWYGIWAFASAGIAAAVGQSANTPELNRSLTTGLLLIFLYWQIVPVLMVNAGVSLDLSRLIIYPVPHASLFRVEAVLGISTALEMVLVVIGLTIGLLLNPELPWWSPASVALFAAMNILLSAGLRDLFARLMGRKRVREVIIFIIVIAAAAPQVLVLTGGNRDWNVLLQPAFRGVWPWSAAARIATGRAEVMTFAVLADWILLAWFFARLQFEKSLRFDAAEHRASRGTARLSSFLESLLRIPDRLFRDPLAVLVGKEIRFLSRAPRFRLVFLMGFSFGLLVWLPFAIRNGDDSAIRTNYLSVVSAYALILLGEVLFWNSFGMDRSAVQNWFVMPVRLSLVLVAKNLAAAFFIFCEFVVVAFICLVIRMPVGWLEVSEAFAVTTVLSIFLIAMGNLVSVRYPRAADPSRSGRSASRAQAYLLVLNPLASLPVLLAYGARYAFDSELAFWCVILTDLFVGAIVYFVALESAADTGWNRREEIIETLSRASSPMTG